MKLYTDYNNPANGANVLVFVYRGNYYWIEDNRLYYTNSEYENDIYRKGPEWTEL